MAGIPTDINGLSPIDKLPRKVLLNDNETATVVVFLSAACPCSDSHVPYLKKLKLEFPQITFIAIHSNMDEDEKTTEAYFKAVNLPFDVIQDVEARLADQFQAFKTPHAFIISKQGKDRVNTVWKWDKFEGNPTNCDATCITVKLKTMPRRDQAPNADGGLIPPGDGP